MSLPESARERAPRKLEELEGRCEKLRREIAVRKETGQHRAAYAITWREAELERLEVLAASLWGALNPASTRDADPATEPIRCRYCSVRLPDRHAAFEYGGSCLACARRGVGLDAPPKPDAEEAHVLDLIARL